MKKLSIFLCAALICLSACGAENEGLEESSASEVTKEAADETKSAEHYLTFTDFLGREIVLPEKPERVIMMTPSYLDMFAQVGGQVVGVPSIPEYLEMDELRQSIEGLPNLGHFAENIEAVMDLKPDLVIGYTRIHDEFIDIFEQSNIPFAIMSTTSYEDTVDTIQLFAQITGKPEKGKEVIAKLEEDIARIKKTMSEDVPTVAILEVTVREVTLERENSIAGSMVDLLGVPNIIANQEAMEGRPDKVPFSMEVLVEKDPDIILFKTMGPMEGLKETLNRELEGNPAWANLTAVKENKIEYLPQELFLVHPGTEYGKALQYLADALKKHE